MCQARAPSAFPPCPGTSRDSHRLTLVPGKQVTMHEAASMPVDQDVEQEAKMVDTYLEKLRAENPLVLREVTKVESHRHA